MCVRIYDQSRRIDWTENVKQDKFYEENEKEEGQSGDGGSKEESKYQLQKQVDIYATRNTLEKVREIAPWLISKQGVTGSKYVRLIPGTTRVV